MSTDKSDIPIMPWEEQLLQKFQDQAGSTLLFNEPDHKTIARPYLQDRIIADLDPALTSAEFAVYLRDHFSANISATRVIDALYPYQMEGVQFLATHPRAYLGDEMGLGKTVQALVAAAALPTIQRLVVICPKSLEGQWRQEIATWLWRPITSVVIPYSAHRRLEAWRDTDVADLVILDEAHFCKNQKAKRTKLALSIAKKTHRAWLLSGTPMPNEPRELYPVFRSLWPELLEPLQITSLQHWTTTFCKYHKTRYGIRVTGIRRPKVLAKLVKKILLRRKVEHVSADLPPLRIQLQRLTAVQDDMGAIRDAAVAFAQHKQLSYNGTSSLAKQVVTHAQPNNVHAATLRKALGMWKADKIAAALKDELSGGQAAPKIVVMAYHRVTLDILEDELAPFNPVRIDGSTSTDQRMLAVRKFRNNPNCKVFIGQQQAAGVGLNLQVANEIVLAEPSWSPEENKQAIKRIHRIGSKKACRARIFVVQNSIDIHIMRALSRKISMLKALGI